MTVSHHMKPPADLSVALVGCLVASRIELDVEPSDQRGGFGAKDMDILDA